MDKKLRLLDSFAARGSDGAAYKVRVYEHLAALAALGGDAETWEPTGLAEYKLDSGEHVVAGRDGTLTVAGSGLVLERV